MKTAELTDGLGKLAEVMETAEFRDLSALCRNAAEELLRRKEVVAVKHTKFYSSVVLTSHQKVFLRSVSCMRSAVMDLCSTH